MDFAIIGAVFAVVGAVFAVALGIGNIGSKAMSAMASREDKETRQEIFQTMLLGSALIEGVALFTAIIGFLIVASASSIL